MPSSVNLQELRSTLRSPSAIAQNPFGVLQSIGHLVNTADEAPTTVEMVLRALEHREAFGPYAVILDALTRRVGLFPYADPTDLDAADLLAYEFHRPEGYDEDIVFHRVQSQVYRYLLAGDNVILSAPTSFGKSKVIDAMVASGKFDNVAIIVPTLALIDETRRRLSRFGARYKLITHTSQEVATRNLFVLTAERLNAFAELPRIDFFVIDEFYKLGMHEDRDRMVALNEAFYKLRKGRGQFYLLGPNIERIPQGAEGTLKARWIQTDFHTVVCEQTRVGGRGSDIDRLVELCRELRDPSIVYCASPSSVNEVAAALVAGKVGSVAKDMDDAASWAAEQFHPEWVFVRALTNGVGIHHGRLPRSLGQLVVRAFNEGQLRFLVCTSTLIEGVNTKAKNVIIFDNKVARRDVDFFTFNNIKGRAGRMFQHFVGHVYLFADAPQEDLPLVDLPLVTQGSDTPASLLVQMDTEDLKPDAARRLEPFRNQNVLPLDIMRQSSAVEPQAQLDAANAITAMPAAEVAKLTWTAFPKYKELQKTCEVIWEHLVPQNRRSSVFSAAQLTMKVWQLQKSPDVPSRILAELTTGGKFAAKSPDEAVERVLSFDRNWASFELPRYLMALFRIQAHVLPKRGIRPGNYSFYAQRLESLFRAPVLSALDEYGIPPTIGEKILPTLGTEDDLDVALSALRKLSGRIPGLSLFEESVVEFARSGL
ncbi:MAG: DEAD/DEAH box helicase [Planctomycetota bacterium]|nr:DEAD/DEAH box helicase [Planctomycetota bacterium]